MCEFIVITYNKGIESVFWIQIGIFIVDIVNGTRLGHHFIIVIINI